MWPKGNSYENDCLVLLGEVSRRNGDRQTYELLSEWTGIPPSTLWNILDEDTTLSAVAARYGYEYVVLARRDTIIDVIYRGI